MFLKVHVPDIGWKCNFEIVKPHSTILHDSNIREGQHVGKEITELFLCTIWSTECFKDLDKNCTALCILF